VDSHRYKTVGMAEAEKCLLQYDEVVASEKGEKSKYDLLNEGPSRISEIRDLRTKC
jgi:hypothetical protein